jgi:flagellar basal-body rod protein FlgG
MVDMINAQRTYQLTSKAIETADQMMEIANQVKK